MATSDPNAGSRLTSDRHDHEPSEELREASIGELLKRLAEDAATLVRGEIALAKSEVNQYKNEVQARGKDAGKDVGMGAGFLGAAAVLGLLALGTLTAFLVLVLNEAMDAWLAALIVGIVYLAIAAFLGLRGKNKLQQGIKKATAVPPPIPEQTIETVKEDVQWLKNQT
jgi:hypothetical protein